MKYGYVRVSSITQNIARQMAEMEKFDIPHKSIYIDKQSGKDFYRTNYQRLKKKLKKGDLLIIKSIDRLGRNYNMIIEEWSDITKKIQADIFVIDFPLLDTRIENENLVGRFIADVVLQVLSFCAQNERENIKERQAEGIRLARERGVHLGRPHITLPKNFDEIAIKHAEKEISDKEATQILKMKRSTFYKYSRVYRANKQVP